MPIRYEATAQQDPLTLIDFGIENGSPNPMAFVAKLKQQIELLETMPHMGRDRFNAGLLVLDLPGTPHLVA